MINLKAQKLGGQATAKIERQKALTEYYSHPNKCLNCNSIIEIKPSEKVSIIKLKKFCNRSCAAIFNNKFYPKRKKLISERRINKKLFVKTVVKSKNFCDVCNTEITKYRKHCDNCIKLNLNRIKSSIDFITKGELFKRRKNWQSARSSIRRRAYVIYRHSNKPKKCIVCGYDKTYQVIHRKSVSSFPDTALISEINDIKNLAALCLNCHWEHDNGHLDITPYVL